ncbi:PX domain-containing protein EREL1 isoform X2 [Euphorbia lathyris]|uniref:PX domain-containing protein EREL1 isoform X2 n=1 Tax=Euphorbia lathyris TaxID=212925 RepID=UPI0033137EF0
MTVQCLSVPRFYRVQVGLQSPEGVTTTRVVLRRFNHFLKLFTDLKKSFPKKNLPSAPPKGLLRIKSRTLLEERRCSLEEWMAKLLSDIDISRSMIVASFLELEASARSSFQDENQQSNEARPALDGTPSSLQIPPHSTSSLAVAGSSVTSEYGSDTAYETSELGSPRLGRDTHFEIGVEDLTLDEDLTNPIEKLVKYGMSNIDEGLIMGQTILEQLEGFPRHKSYARHGNNFIGKDTYNGNVSKASSLSSNGLELFSEPEPGKVFGHTRKLSSESVGSDGSSLRGSEVSNFGMPNSSGDGSLDLPGGAEISSVAGDSHIVLPSDQRQRISRVLLTMQRRLGSAKTDMEDLIARLNQEMAVKDYLTTKVKDLEAELDISKQKNKENLQQAVLIERERLTQMQWDMEDLRRKSLEMELKLKSKEVENSGTGLKRESNDLERYTQQELDDARKQLEHLSKQYEELEAKSKADIKFLAKEFKSLKRSDAELKEKLGQSLKEKSEIEKLLQEERQMNAREKNARKKLLHDCNTLCNRLRECTLNLSVEDDDKFIMDFSLVDALDLLSTSDDQIGCLLAEARVLFEDDDDHVAASDDDDTRTTDEELRKLLGNIFNDNAKLRTRVNSVIRSALRTGNKTRNNDEMATKENE